MLQDVYWGQIHKDHLSYKFSLLKYSNMSLVLSFFSIEILDAVSLHLLEILSMSDPATFFFRISMTTWAKGFKFAGAKDAVGNGGLNSKSVVSVLRFCFVLEGHIITSFFFMASLAIISSCSFSASCDCVSVSCPCKSSSLPSSLLASLSRTHSACSRLATAVHARDKNYR